MGRPAKQKIPPKTEVDLQELQRKYLENKNDPKVFEEYFMLLRVYARSLALKEIKRKNIYLPGERVDEIATDATLLLLNQYRKEGWCVGSSFAGVLRWKVVEAMYKQANEDMVYSLNTTFTNEADSKEILDIMGNSPDRTWETVSGGSIENDPSASAVKDVNVSFDEINAIIDIAYEILDYKLYVKFLPWLLLQFRKPKSRNSQVTFNSVFLTSREEDAFDVLLLEIRNRIAQHVI